MTKVHTTIALCVTMVSLPACFASAEVGVAVPVSGPVKSSPTTSLGVAVGFAYDFGLALVGVGRGLVVHEVTRDSGEVDEVTSMGTHFRADVTLDYSLRPIIPGANFGKIFRVTTALQIGGCRKLAINSMAPEDGCDASPAGDGMLVSMGALAGIRSDKGDVLSISVSPYYMRSKHPTQPLVALGGAKLRISISGVPKALSGFATVSKNYDWSEDRRRRAAAADRNERRGRAMRCKGTLTKDRNGREYCKR